MEISQCFVLHALSVGHLYIITVPLWSPSPPPPPMQPSWCMVWCGAVVCVTGASMHVAFIDSLCKCIPSRGKHLITSNDNCSSPTLGSAVVATLAQNASRATTWVVVCPIQEAGLKTPLLVDLSQGNSF